MLRKTNNKDNTKIREKISLYWLCVDEDTLNQSEMINEKTKLFAKEIRKYSSTKEKIEMFNNLRVINSEFKNNKEFVINLKTFFTEYSNCSQEEIYGLIFQRNAGEAMLLSLSDFGTNLSYVKDSLDLNNIFEDDWENIKMCFSFIYSAIFDPVKTEIEFNRYCLDSLIPQKTITKQKLAKF